MFKKAEHDVIFLVDAGKKRRVERREPRNGWVFEIGGREFFLYKAWGRWHVSDIPTGRGLYATGITRGEAVAVFERSYYPAYLRTIGQEPYQKFIEKFERMPRHAA